PRVRFDPASVAALEPTARPAIEIPESVPMPSAVRETRPAQKRTPIVRAEPPEAAAPESPPLAAAQLSSARRIKRIDYLNEFNAVRQWTDVLTLDLDDATKKTLLAAKPTTTKGKDAKTEPVHALLEVAEKRGDLQGLPLRQAKDCQKKKEAALVMQALSRHFRSLDASFSRRRAGTASHLDDVKEEVALLNTLQNLDLPNQGKGGVRRLKGTDRYFWWAGKMGSDELAFWVQMLKINGPAVRFQLVKMLDACSDAPSSVLLAQRALFDLDPDVRAAAVAAM